MEQLIFFPELPSPEYAELEGLIDPKLDADFLADISEAFAKLDALSADAVSAA